MARKRRKVNKLDRHLPTPETLAKLTDDPLGYLVREGWVDTAGERAAMEIRAVYPAISKGLGYKISSISDMVSGGAAAEMSDSVAQAYSERFKPWALRHREKLVQTVITLVVDSEQIPCGMSAPVCRALADYARGFKKGDKR